MKFINFNANYVEKSHQFPLDDADPFLLFLRGCGVHEPRPVRELHSQAVLPAYGVIRATRLAIFQVQGPYWFLFL